MKLDFVLLRLAYFSSPILVFRLGGITLSDYLFAISFIAILLKSPEHQLASKIVAKFHLPILLIFSSAGISIAVNANRLDAFMTFIKFLILLVIIPITTKKLCNTFSEFESLIQSYISGLVVFSIYTMVSRIAEFGISTSVAVERSRGLAEHVTDAGGICAISFIACLTFLKPKFRFVKALILTITLFALGSTGSISGLIASLVGYLLYLIYQNAKSARFQRFQLFFFGLVAIFALNRYLSISSRFKHATSGRYDTAATRIENWTSTLSIATDSLKNLLFGRGLHPKDNVVITSTGELLGPHNFILEGLSAGGIFFSIGLLIYLIQILALSYKQKIPNNFIPLLGSSLIFAMTSPLMYSRYIWLPFLLALQQALLNERLGRRNA